MAKNVVACQFSKLTSVLWDKLITVRALGLIQRASSYIKVWMLVICDTIFTRQNLPSPKNCRDIFRKLPGVNTDLKIQYIQSIHFSNVCVCVCMHTVDVTVFTHYPRDIGWRTAVLSWQESPHFVIPLLPKTRISTLESGILLSI